MSCHGPKPLGDAVTHYWLALNMAKAVGVDLVAEMEAGRLAAGEWAELVHRCRGCDWQRADGGCGRWLEFQIPGDAAVPGACVNRETFEGLLAAE
ncbi:MAG: hypothetical protein KDA73_02085 [Rhodobacteraceae bacterium]|nr:hypothetical protein [Paracoccaceae bacterium]